MQRASAAIIIPKPGPVHVAVDYSMDPCKGHELQVFSILPFALFCKVPSWPNASLKQPNKVAAEAPAAASQAGKYTRMPEETECSEACHEDGQLNTMQKQTQLAATQSHLQIVKWVKMPKDGKGG